MLNDLVDLDLHVHALYTHDAAGRILTINEPNGRKQAPRFYFGRSAAGNTWRFRADLPSALVNALEELCGDEPVGPSGQDEPRHAAEYVRLVGTHGPIRERWSGPAYRFVRFDTSVSDVVQITERNADRLRGGFEAWLADVSDWQPFVAATEDDRVVAVCQSVRITPHAHEAGVDTRNDSRRRGHGRRVVAEWARLVRERGAQPLYSTSWQNVASQGLARSLGLDMFAVDFHLS